MKTQAQFCVDCQYAPATIVAPAIHSFDDKGKPNGSKEAICLGCAEYRWATVEHHNYSGLDRS